MQDKELLAALEQLIKDKSKLEKQNKELLKDLDARTNLIVMYEGVLARMNRFLDSEIREIRKIRNG